MTSKAQLARREAARSELETFNSLPRRLRDVLNDCEGQPPKASIVLQTLLRGVGEDKIIETIKRSQGK